jgi:hypothetical protein
MALTKNARTLVASATNTAGSTARGTVDLNAVQGPSVLTFKITNGGTGPTVQCTCKVMVAHASSLPTAGAEGTDWKTLFPPVGPGTGASASVAMSYTIPAAVMCLEVEFTGNTGQSVTVEAYMSEFTSIS